MRETLQLIFSIRNHVKARVGSSFLSNFRTPRRLYDRHGELLRARAS